MSHDISKKNSIWDLKMGGDIGGGGGKRRGSIGGRLNTAAFSGEKLAVLGVT